jgi:hypothetical protein
MPRQKITTLDTKLEFVKDRAKKTIDIALERVIAHNENPGYYPLPSDPRSLERAFYKLFETMPRKKQKELIEKVNRTLKAGKEARTKIYGDLANVDFRSKTAIVDQVKVKPVPENIKITEADVTELRRRLKLPAAVTPPSAVKPQKRSRPVPAQAAEATELGLDVVSVKCIRPTDVRKDEVSLTGCAVDNVGGAVTVAPFFIGDFKKDETLALGAQGRLFNFKLTEGEFPKSFNSVVFLVEKDLLRNSELVAALHLVVYALSVALMTAATVVLIIGLAGGPVTLLLFLILFGGSLFMSGVASIIRVMRDDVSECAADTLLLEAPVAPGTTFDRDPITVNMGDYKGKYEIDIRWVAA